MNRDLLTTIVAAIAGAVIAYVVCGLFLPEIRDFSFKVLDSNINYNITQPNPEIFNYRAIDPTVPSVVDPNCTEYDETGKCISSIDNSEEPSKDPDFEPEENPGTNPEETPEENPEVNPEPISPDEQPSGGGGGSGPTN